MKVKRYTKGGSLTVEVAIILPLVILSVMTIAFIMRVHLYQLQAEIILIDEAQRISVEAYDKQDKGFEIYHYLSLANRIKKRSRDETHLEEPVKLLSLNYMFPQDGLTNLIEINSSYNTDIPFPYYKELLEETESKVLFRPFVGHSLKDTFFKEEETEDLIVWVFPRAGEKYHLEDCTYIQVYARKTELTKDIKNAYSPCPLCKPSKDEKAVFIFPKSGTVYHLEGCYLVDRYVIPMYLEEAINEGYTPCKKCKGGKGN